MASVDLPHPLGRILHHDPANWDHRAYTVAPRRPDQYMVWYSPDVYDQGRESNCTTEAAIGLCRTSPVKFRFSPTSWARFDTEPERFAFYKWAQKYDPASWGVHDGSASDSPYKGLRELGLIAGWKWLFGTDEIKQWVMYDGPCTIGIDWLSSMFTPRWYTPPRLTRGCYLNVDQASPLAGGHEIRVIGYSPGRKAFRLVNSWGTSWGDSGRAWLLEDDMRNLVDLRRGDAVTVTP